MTSEDPYDDLLAPKTSESTSTALEIEEKEIPKNLNTVTCPYNKEHKVPVEGFNAHIWKCRSGRMGFYPNALSLKRCRYNIRHFVPEEELAFHELFCETQYAELYAHLETEPVHLDIDGFLAAQKLQRDLEDGDDYIWDEEDQDSTTSSSSDKVRSVTSEVETSDVEEAEPEDSEIVVKRLECLEIMKKNGIH